jgi:hypothetical protein
MQGTQGINDTPILDAVDPDVMGELVDRRDEVAQTATAHSASRGALAAALALGSVPVALAALTRDVYGQAPTSTIVDTLQFALLLENLEAEFYKAVTGTSSVSSFSAAFAPVRSQLTGSELATLQVIRDHEIAHVSFLQSALTSLGAPTTIYNPGVTFDFTGGRGTGTGPFAAATTDKSFLLIAAQLFEDTGVRAYKGQAGNLLRTGSLLTAALQIHAVEARHAARIRRMRKALGAPAEVRAHGVVDGEGTIAAGVPNAGSLPLAAQLVVYGPYQGEGNHNHVVNNGTADVTIDTDTLPNIVLGPDVNEAFDEPLTRGQVYQIVRPFVIPGLPFAP